MSAACSNGHTHTEKFIPEFTELIQGYIPGALGDNEGNALPVLV